MNRTCLVQLLLGNHSLLDHWGSKHDVIGEVVDKVVRSGDHRRVITNESLGVCREELEGFEQPPEAPLPIGLSFSARGLSQMSILTTLCIDLHARFMHAGM